MTKTADLCDQFTDRVSIADAIFRDYGGVLAFSGKIATVKVYQDNAKVKEALSEPGEGRVLVVDAAGSLYTALVGDILTSLAIQNGWTGLVVNGAIRDSETIRTLPIGVKALGTIPRRSAKRGIGERDLPVSFAGVTFVPGQMLYADGDGVVVAQSALV